MSSSSRLRWGILGAARVNERLLPAIVAAPNAELVAIASRRPEAAAETLKKYAPGTPGVSLYNHLDGLLQDPRVEAVYLPMGNDEHAEWAIKALQAGKHVLIEKPMALTVEDITASARNLKVMEGFMYRFHPQHQRVQEIVASGVLGDLRYAHASFSFLMRPARLYRLAKDTAHGGGAMWDVGPYAIHTLRHCFGSEPIAVSAMAKYAESGADISASGILDFGDGKRGHFDVSFECSRQSEYRIVGNKGSLICHTVWQLPGTSDVPTISWWTDDGQKHIETYAPSNHFNLEIAHFSDCVLNNKTPLLSLQDAKANCSAIVATLQAAASGRTVTIAAQ